MFAKKIISGRKVCYSKAIHALLPHLPQTSVSGVVLKKCSSGQAELPFCSKTETFREVLFPHSVAYGKLCPECGPAQPALAGLGLCRGPVLWSKVASHPLC